MTFSSPTGTPLLPTQTESSNSRVTYTEMVQTVNPLLVTTQSWHVALLCVFQKPRRHIHCYGEGGQELLRSLYADRKQVRVASTPFADTKPKVDVEINVSRELSVEQHSSSILKSLDMYRIGKDLNLQDLLKFWEIHDILCTCTDRVRWKSKSVARLCANTENGIAACEREL